MASLGRKSRCYMAFNLNFEILCFICPLHSVWHLENVCATHDHLINTSMKMQALAEVFQCSDKKVEQSRE